MTILKGINNAWAGVVGKGGRMEGEGGGGG